MKRIIGITKVIDVTHCKWMVLVSKAHINHIFMLDVVEKIEEIFLGLHFVS